MATNIKIKLIRNTSEFSFIEHEWKEFEITLNHPKSTMVFLLNSLKNIYKDVKKLKLKNTFNLQKLFGAHFFIVYRQKFGIKVSFIEFLGQQWAGNYLDIISDTKNAIYNNEIFQWLNNNVKYDILLLKYIPQYSANFNIDYLYLYSACPEIQIDEYSKHDEYIKNKYSKNLKQNLRTAYNRAKKSDIEIKTSIEEINQNNFNDIVQISEFKVQDGKSSMFKDENKLLFMKEITKVMSSNVVFVKLNKKNVAYRTNVFFNNNKFCIDASYDRDFRKFELGSISVDANLNDSSCKNISRHCLGPGLDLYKRKFTNKNVNIFIYLKQGNTLLSHLLIKPMKYLASKKETAFKKDLNR